MFCLQEIAALDLYCGCGGLSFIDGVHTDDGVEIKTKWVVDYNESCCASFQTNYPEAQVCVGAVPCNAATISFQHILDAAAAALQICSVPVHAADNHWL